jgi:AhpD family alkylhydroperoxidase
MRTNTMQARIDIHKSTMSANFFAALARAAKPLSSSTVPKATFELVKIRASQINGCAYCTDMHIKDAAHAGETAERLHLVVCWREALCFSAAERAALALTEEATRLADNPHGVGDEVWQEVRQHYDEEQALALIGQIALINAFNLINVALRNPAGGYTPGQWG